MKNEVLTLNSIINKGKYKGKTISEIIDIDRKEMINLFKKGYYFDDEVMEKSRFKRVIRDVKCENVIAEHLEKDTKVYTTDTKNINEILKDILTLDNTYKDVDEEDSDDTEEYSEYSEGLDNE